MMPLFKTAAVALIALLVSAQAQVQYYIDPNSVPLATRRKCSVFEMLGIC